MTISTEDITPLREQIGTIIQEERLRLGLTTGELARACETAKAQVESIESGSSAYTVDTLLRVTAALGMNMVFLNGEFYGYPTIGLDAIDSI